MGIFDIFSNKSILCPYDLVETRYTGNIGACPSCKTNFPPLYYQTHKECPPFFLQMTGWSQVGKSAFLLSLTYVLQQMNPYWGTDFVIMPETDPTMKYFQQASDVRLTGKVPTPTQLRIQDAFIIQMKNMPRWGNRTLVTRDVAGEAFEGQMELPLEYMPYLLHVPTTLMLTSPIDMIPLKDGDNSAEKQKRLQPEIQHLMTKFINTLAKAGHDFRKVPRRVIVIISKADKLSKESAGPIQLYPDLISYLQAGELSPNNPKKELANTQKMDVYMNTLTAIGERTREYVMDCIPGGRQLVAQAKDYNISLDFCLVSSLGSDVGPNGVLEYNLNPMRVLDPLLLALDQQSY
jgi:hypothetical protein